MADGLNLWRSGQWHRCATVPKPTSGTHKRVNTSGNPGHKAWFFAQNENSYGHLQKFMSSLRLNDKIDRARQWFHKSVAINNRVQVEASQVSLRRLVITAGLVVTLNIVYIIWFWGFQLGTATPATRLWIQLVGGAHAVCAVLLTGLGVMAHRFNQQTIARKADDADNVDARKALVLHGAMVAVALLLGAALSVADQLVAANTTMFALISLACAMLSLMRPVLTAVLFLAVYGVLFIALPYTQPDPQLLAISRSHAFAATLVSLLASSLTWHQYVQSTLLSWKVQSAHSALTAKQAELEYLATHDVLTGLLNRREFMRVLRQPAPTSLIMVDLDFFKKINDTYGHPAGDTVLVAVAAALAQAVRKSDVLARLGGEEFIVLLPNTDLAGAAKVAQKLLTHVRELPIPFAGQQLRVTASFGVSCLPQGAESTADALYASADKALYLAKHSGRDRVELAP